MKIVHKSVHPDLPILQQLSGFFITAQKYLFSVFIFRAIILLFSLFLSLSSDLYAKNSRIEFERISDEQGLSQLPVLTILQNKTGFLWFGTFSGLNRYDGKSVKVFRYDPDDPNSLSDNAIRSISEDSSGIFWIGTENGGFNRFDPETEKSTRYMNDPDDPNSLSNNSVRAVCKDSYGKLWIGTGEEGLNRFDPETGNFIRFMNDPDDPDSLICNKVVCICEDGTGMIWVGTMEGLNRIDPSTMKFTRYINDPDDPESLSHNYVQSIYEDGKGALWIGTRGGGLNRFEPEAGKFTRYINDPDDPRSLSRNKVFSIYGDSKGMLWIGTEGGGLNRFDPENSKFTRYINDPDDPGSLSSNQVSSLYEDSSGILWIGTELEGLNKLELERKKFHLFQNNPNNLNSLCNNNVWTMIEDRSGMIWIGTLDGLDRFDPKRGLFTHFRKDSDNPNSLGYNKISALCEDSSGILWIGTHGEGLDRFDPQTEKFTHYRPNPANPHSLSHDLVIDIYGDVSGMLWVGTYGGGLNRMDTKTGRFKHFQNDPDDPGSLSSNAVIKIYEDTSGVLWVGTFGGGLNRLNPEDGRFRRLQHDPDDPGSLSHNAVASINEDSSGVLWVGTYGGGLNKFDRENDVFTRYSTKEGLPDDTVMGIHEDTEGNLWLTTLKGLAKFNPTSITFKNYDKSDGIQSDYLKRGSFKSRSGEIYLSSPKGFSTFYPREIKDNPHAPHVVLTNFKLFNESVPLGENADGRTLLKKDISATREVTLSYKDDNIYFEFAALHFTAPEKNEYAYIMEGFESEWNHVGNRNFATYTNLPPGRFVFRVKASNNDGIWNEEGTSLKITVIPPFWQTWWFFTLTGIAILFLGFTVHRIRTESIRKRNLELEEYNLQLNKQIRERKFAEEALRESEERLQSILDNSTAVVYLKDTQGKYILINSQYETLFHITKAQIIGKTDYDIFPEQMSDALRENDRKVLEEDRPLEFEEIVPQDDGIHIYISIKFPIHEASGIPYGVCGISTDITERKRDEEELKKYREQLEDLVKERTTELQKEITERKVVELALRRERDKIQNILDTAEVILLLLDLEGRIILINRKGCELLGYTEAELVGKNMFFTCLPQPEGREIIFEDFKLITVGDIDRHEYYESPVMTRSGQERLIAWHNSFIFDEKGQIIGTLSSGEDVTERKQMENELLRSKEVAETANRAKSEFLANMSHELRTPLNAILGFSQIMGRDSELNPGQKENINTITRSGEHLLDLINDVLEISKIEAGRVVLDETAFDLNQMLDALQSMFRIRASEKGLGLHFERAPEVPQYIRTDARRLRQVLMNLISNAVKFTEQGSVTLQLRIADRGLGIEAGGQRSEARGRSDTEIEKRGNGEAGIKEESKIQNLKSKIIFEIKDTGPGIAAEEIDDLFEPFRQTKSGKRATEGTGLGLPISRKFVRLMGGDITVTSKVGHGSVFAFDIPVTETKATDIQQPSPERRVVGLAPDQGAFRILVVDDVEDNRSLMVKLMEAVGLETRVAKNGQEAIEVWETWHPHLIWMDMAMPVMDGYEATKRIRNLEFGFGIGKESKISDQKSKIRDPKSKIQRTPIIALTAVAFKEEREKMLASGCDDVVHKPLRETDIFDCMAKHLELHYIYEEEPSRAALSGIEYRVQDILIPENLAELPDELLANLKQALIDLDTNLIQSVIEEIHQLNASIGNALAAMAKDFQYDKLLTLIQP